MLLLKLTCANCSAPLEVGDDLERFACAYCGTTQIVERSGGVVALRKVESAIHAVQRGTDRTAAELAIPRLQRELTEAKAAKREVLAAFEERLVRAKSGRRKLTWIVFLALFFTGPTLAISVGSSYPVFGNILTVLIFLCIIVVPIFVYRKIKLPRDTRKEDTAKHDALIARLEDQLRANRSILDSNPS